MYAASLIKKSCYWLKQVLVDLIDTQFEDNEDGGVGMIEARTEDNKLQRIFFTKEPYYVMNIIASLITLDELEGANTRKHFIDRSRMKETNQFT